MTFRIPKPSDRFTFETENKDAKYCVCENKGTYSVGFIVHVIDRECTFIKQKNRQLDKSGGDALKEKESIDRPVLPVNIEEGGCMDKFKLACACFFTSSFDKFTAWNCFTTE